MSRTLLFFGVFIFFKTMGADPGAAPSFDSIIMENANNPAKVIELLKKIRQSSCEADAFLRKFGEMIMERSKIQ